MDIYLAESGNMLKYVAQQEGESVFNGVKFLHSFYYCDEWVEREIIPRSSKFLLDSGAFTFFSKGAAVNWDAYIKAYAKFINRNNIQYFFELDIDKLIGYEKVVYYRKKLEDMTGKPSIPVWHVSRGKDEFVSMCEEYDYVAFGGMNTDGVGKAKLVKYLPWFVSTAHQHGAKIHGLGFTSMKDLRNIRFDSVDSTAWVSGVQFGFVYKFDGKTMQKIDSGEGQRLVQYRKAGAHCFKEWVKFQKYAETHL